MRKLFIYVSAVLFAASPAISQNIVTYLGEEKIEKTDEGVIFHQFSEGLLLPGSVNAGTLYNGQDMVAWLYATGKFVTPHAGDTVPYAYPNVVPFEPRQIPAAFRFTPLPQWKWAPVTVDSLGRFQHPSMRSAYLYNAYVSPSDQLAVLETTGGTRVYINGIPHEGDHYDFGYTLIPVRLKKGLNEFIHTPGRFGRVAVKLVRPLKPVMFTKRDQTTPDLLIGEPNPQWAAIRVMNTSEKTLRGLTVRATLPDGKSAEQVISDLVPLSVRKVKYLLPAVSGNAAAGEVTAKIELLTSVGKVIDETEITLRRLSPAVHHDRTFISRVDGSVQYFGVAPATRQTPGETKGLVLSVHGAGVEAHGQIACYAIKDWTDVVAATNRRPYGFNWEDWGRIDALEVLEEARRIYRPDPAKIYLTGHSMGGHGTWYIGTTYPDKFAAIAPCASYPDIATYGRGRLDDMHRANPRYEAFERGANTGRTLSLIENLKQSGVYIFHGDADRVVPTEQARQMREVLGRFHPDFCYYEYPGGEHWFGNISLDWNPIFEFFKRHTIPAAAEVKEVDFHTASPAVSASDYWVCVGQQVSPLRFSNVKATQEKDTIRVTAVENVSLLTLDVPALHFTAAKIPVYINNQEIPVPSDRKAILSLQEDGRWNVIDQINPKHKNPARYGGFKSAYDNHVVLVYATRGNAKENEWYRQKACFDAETFYYRANGSIDVIPDTEYSCERYKDRNVVIYGNSNNNRVWSLLLKDCPIQVKNGEITAGKRSYKGTDLGAYYLYPHPLSDTALVGVVAGTGDAGMRATSPNNYISGITGFPDLMIFSADALRTGLEGVHAAGYFDADWSLEKGDF
ncbi:MAG: prolyl oligopeptidase family serine peptidase [Tannerella sp.]|jgi:pimeloyl-ACP methyl ester carboxylesterase|nr:prolyl oligopeptidase family serine peptidase [Tannerella sp.]